MPQIDKLTLTIADYEILGKAYINLLDAGMVLANIEYDDFLEAVITGEPVTYNMEEL